MLESFKELIAWQKSMDLVTQIYQVTSKFPQSEMYGLSSQIKRAVVSIPSNISEGYQRKTKNEYLQFLYISYGSCAEVETQLRIARNLSFISDVLFETTLFQLSEVSKILHGLLNSLKNGDRF